MNKTNKFRLHVPGYYYDSEEISEYEFSTLEELLAIPEVALWNRYKGNFSLDDDRLIYTWDNGYKWWVIGYIKHPKEIDLPIW